MIQNLSRSRGGCSRLSYVNTNSKALIGETTEYRASRFYLIFFFFSFSLFFDLQALINIYITWKLYKVLSEGYFFAACIKTLSYAARYHLNVIFGLNDLRIFEPIAQIWFHLKSKNQPSAYKSALKQNHSMNKCSYSVLWLINRNSKARRIDQLNYRIQGLSFPYHWVTKALTVICLPLQRPLSNLHMLALRGPEFCCFLRWSNTGQCFREMDSFFKAMVFDPWFDNDRGLGPISRKSWELFGPEKPIVKLQSTCFEKMIF